MGLSHAPGHIGTLLSGRQKLPAHALSINEKGARFRTPSFSDRHYSISSSSVGLRSMVSGGAGAGPSFVPTARPDAVAKYTVLDASS
jgi:hypothetical protein